MTTGNKELVNLLERSILPALVNVVEAVGKQSHRYENYIKDIKAQIESIDTDTSSEELSKEFQKLHFILNRLEQNANQAGAGTQSQAFGVLTETIVTFGDKLSELTNTNNQLVDSHKEVIHAFEENTARLDILTLTLKDYLQTMTRDEDPVFEHLQKETENLSYDKANKSSTGFTKAEKPMYQEIDERIRQFEDR